MELSSFEITRLVSELDLENGYYVSNAYRLGEGSFMLKLHHPELPDALLVLDKSGFWITKYEIGKVEGDRFLKSLRKWLLRARFKGARQPGSERIVEFEFDKGERLYLVLELFGSGNLILLDRSRMVLDCLKEVRVKGRTVARGLKYEPPKGRGVDLKSVDEGLILKVRESELEVSRWIGRSLGLPRKYTEEILYRAGIKPRLKGRELDEGEVRRIYETLRELVSLSEGKGEAYAYFRDSEPILSPFELKSMKGVRVEKFGSMMDALDELVARRMVEEKERSALEPLRAKLDSINRSIKGKERAVKGLEAKVKALLELAEGLKSGYLSGAEEGAVLDSLGARREGGVICLEREGERFAFKGGSLMGMASKVYDRAKKLRASMEALKASIRVLEEDRERLKAKLERGELKLAPPKRARRKRWFERYRWFVTSDGCLALGGRDASSNVSLIRKHARRGDLIFHADLHGSPFFILRGCRKESSIKEVALATVCFSRAWREGYGYGDAYWVEFDQVKLAAPSGMYLPKGGLLITGRKNFVKGLKLSVSVGVCRLDGDLILMSGPPSAVKKYSLAYVELVPFKGKVSETAKKVREKLASLLEEASSIGLDEFVSVLPGPGKPVSLGRGEGTKVIIEPA